MGFQQYIPGQGGRRARDTALISKTGVLTMHPELLAPLGSPTHILVYFDPDTDKLALRAAPSPSDRGAIQLRLPSKASVSLYVNLAGLFAFYGLKPARERYRPVLDGQRLVFGPITRADAPSSERVRSMLAAAR